jgi:hypothetical protein
MQLGPCYLKLLMGETHGTSGQCVSFSLFDAGSVLLPAQFFFSFLFFSFCCNAALGP